MPTPTLRLYLRKLGSRSALSSQQPVTMAAQLDPPSNTNPPPATNAPPVTDATSVTNAASVTTPPSTTNPLRPTSAQRAEVCANDLHVRQGLADCQKLLYDKKEHIETIEAQIISYCTTIQGAQQAKSALMTLKDCLEDFGRLQASLMFLTEVTEEDIEGKSPSEVVELYRRKKEEFENMKRILREMAVDV